MYRRYSQVNGEGVSLSQMKRNRIRDIVILLLAAGLATLAVFAVPAFQYRADERAILVQKMQSECGKALNITSVLSRTGGQDSYQRLAEIRSYLYSIRTMNEVYRSQTLDSLLPDEEIQTLLSMVDNYLQYLNKGMDTGEYQTSLQNTLTNLQTELGGL